MLDPFSSFWITVRELSWRQIFVFRCVLKLIFHFGIHHFHKLMIVINYKENIMLIRRYYTVLSNSSSFFLYPFPTPCLKGIRFSVTIPKRVITNPHKFLDSGLLFICIYRLGKRYMSHKHKNSECKIYLYFVYHTNQQLKA